MKGISTQILRAFSLVVTDRRWAAPLSAMALGFGLFVGVAIGPSASGTLAGTPRIVEVPSFGGGESETAVEGGGEAATAAPPLAGSLAGGAGGEAGALGVLPAPAPLVPAPAEEPPAEEPAPEPTAPAGEAPAEEAEEEEATELQGVVMHANLAAGSYALAIKGGELVPVHARKLPPPGAKLTVVARRLANGTFAEEEKPRRSGRAATATFRGTVTFADADPVAPSYTVSGRGSSLPVLVDPDPSGAPPALPAVGSYATVTVAIEKPQPVAEPVSPAPPPVEGAPPVEAPPPAPSCARDPALPPLPPAKPAAVLRQRQLELEEAPPSTYLDLAGILTAVCADAGQLLLSSDGARESEGDLTLAVPTSIGTAKLKLGDSFLATATVGEDGSLTLAGLVGDEQVKGADDPGSAQGDLKR